LLPPWLLPRPCGRKRARQWVHPPHPRRRTRLWRRTRSLGPTGRIRASKRWAAAGPADAGLARMTTLLTNSTRKKLRAILAVGWVARQRQRMAAGWAARQRQPMVAQETCTVSRTRPMAFRGRGNHLPPGRYREQGSSRGVPR